MFKLIRDFILPAVVIFFSVLFLGLLFVGHFTTALGGNPTMYIYAGNLILAGQTPFVDFFDINPPFIMYLTSWLNQLAQITGLNSVIFFKWTVGLFVLFAVHSSSYLLVRHKILSFRQASALVLALLLANMLQVFLFTFGDRDQLLGLIILPYALLRFIRVRTPLAPLGLGLSSMIGILCGVIVAFKPNFLIWLIGIEIYLMFQNGLKARAFRAPEFVLTILVQFIVYAELLRPKPGNDYFWTQHLPAVIKYYSAYNWIPGDSVFYMITFFLGLISAAVSSFFFRKLDDWSRFIVFLSWIALLSVILQGKWYPYHFAPLQIVLVCQVVVVICSLSLRRSSLFRIHFGLGITLLSLFIYHGHRYISSAYAEQPSSPYSREVRDILNGRTAEGDYVLPILGPNAIYYSFMISYKLKLASRYLMQYPLNFYGAQRYKNGFSLYNHSLSELEPLEQKYAEDFKEDVQRYKPKVIWYLDSSERIKDLRLVFSLTDYLGRLGILEFLKNDYELVDGPGNNFVYLRKNI